ncbi:MAG: DUF2027 domain-containing protein [Bacteroidia bacterium]|nr:DUF2027 domain-containing protein [Bacteroidia bacterium]
MNKFSVGDKVSFKNEPQSGIITGFRKKDMVMVEVDGFEIPVHASELILIEKVPTPEIPSVLPETEKAVKKENVFSWLQHDALFLLAAPSEKLQVFTGAVNYFLVNHTSFHLLFTVSFMKDEEYITLARGTVNAGDNLLLFRKTREELSEWKKMNVQLIYFSENLFELKKPQSHDISVLMPDLKEETTGAEGLFNYAKVVMLSDFSEKEMAVEKLKEHFKSGPSSKKIKAERKAVLKNDDVIDLHIEKITDDYRSLDTAAILRMQLEVFRRELEVAIRNHYYRIIFIHGIGEGILRQALIDELKFYHGLTAKPASHQKFGNGAIEIQLR